MLDPVRVGTEGIDLAITAPGIAVYNMLLQCLCRWIGFNLNSLLYPVILISKIMESKASQNCCMYSNVVIQSFPQLAIAGIVLGS